MLTLMQSVGEISIKIKDKEFQRILDTFSITEIFNAFIQNGEVKVLCKKDTNYFTDSQQHIPILSRKIEPIDIENAV